MKILHIMHDYKPRIGGSVVRNAGMIDAYKRNFDDKVYLINLAGNEYKSKECIDGVEIYRCKKLSEMISVARSIVIEEDIEILHAHNYRFMFAAFIVKYTCPQKHLKIVTEMHSLYRMRYFKELVAYYLLRRSNAVIVLADAAKQYLTEEKRVDNNLIVSIGNGISEVEYSKDRDFEIYRQLLKAKENYCIAAYFGTFYKWQGVLFIAQNVDKILQECPDLYLVMIGNGPEFYKTGELIKNSKYRDRILLCDSIVKEQLYNLYELVDIMLIPRLKNLSTDTAIPLKAVEAMEFSKCILAGNDNGLKEVLNERNAGLFISGDINSFIEELRRLLDDEKLRRELGEQASEDSQKLFHTWDDNALRVKEIYRRIKKDE